FTVLPRTVPGPVPSAILPMATARHFTLGFPNLRLNQPLLSHDRTPLRRTDKPAMPTQRSASPARTQLRELPWFLTKRDDQAEHAHRQSIHRQRVKQDMY